MLPASTGQAERDDALQKAFATGGGLARELCSRECGTAGRARIIGPIRQASGCFPYPDFQGKAGRCRQVHQSV